MYTDHGVRRPRRQMYIPATSDHLVGGWSVTTRCPKKHHQQWLQTRFEMNSNTLLMSQLYYAATCGVACLKFYSRVLPAKLP